MLKFNRFFLSLFALLAATTAFVSCDENIDWTDTCPNEKETWIISPLNLYFVDDNTHDRLKSTILLEDPATWPVVSDKPLSREELAEKYEKMEKVEVNSGAGYRYDNGHAYVLTDEENKLVFMRAALKCNNTAQTRTYLYHNGKENIFDINFRYTKSKGTWYTEINKVRYNDAVIYESGSFNNPNIIIREK